MTGKAWAPFEFDNKLLDTASAALLIDINRMFIDTCCLVNKVGLILVL
jgi:hypothetical protein